MPAGPDIDTPNFRDVTAVVTAMTVMTASMRRDENKGIR